MIKVFVIDDQEFNRETLKQLISEISENYELVGEAENISTAFERIIVVDPELVFLDIEMPGGTGFELLSNLGEVDFDVIVTSAHNQYALDAIKVSALDYLLKPFTREEFLKSIRRYEEKRKRFKSKKIELEAVTRIFKNLNLAMHQIGLQTSEGITFVKLNEIVRCTSTNHGVDFYFVSNKIISISKSANEVDSLLNDKNFFRINDDHLINLNHISKIIFGIEPQIILSNNDHFDISPGIELEINNRLKELKMEFE